MYKTKSIWKSLINDERDKFVFIPVLKEEAVIRKNPVLVSCSDDDDYDDDSCLVEYDD